MKNQRALLAVELFDLNQLALRKTLGGSFMPTE
jgi:hypothetical protein